MAALKTLTGEHWKIHVADVRSGVELVDTQSVQTVITSPPYWQQRDYGFEGQIGLEKTHNEYVAAMVNVFSCVHRVLRDDGTLFVNLGDSYTKDSKFGGFSNSKNKYLADNAALPRGYRMISGLQAGNLVGIPWRVAFALQDDGWILRQCIVWAKPAPMPESISGWRWKRCKLGRSGVIDCLGCEKCRGNGGYVLARGMWRPTTSHEFIFMFSKSERYFCDGDGSKEPVSGGAHTRGNWLNPKVVKLDHGESRDNRPKQNDSFSSACSDLVETRNVRSVFRIGTEGFKGAHFACYPTEVVRRCLVAAVSPGGACADCGTCYSPIVETLRKATRTGNDSKVGRVSDDDGSPYEKHQGMIVGNRDPQRHTTVTHVLGYRPSCQCGTAETRRPVVLDPFCGSGTTGQVAINMGCNFVGIEAKPEYAELAVERLNTPWVPVSERKKPNGKRRKKLKDQKQLF